MQHLSAIRLCYVTMLRYHPRYLKTQDVTHQLRHKSDLVVSRDGLLRFVCTSIWSIILAMERLS